MQVCTPCRQPRQHPTTQFFYRPDALPDAQPTASKHWRHFMPILTLYFCYALIPSVLWHCWLGGRMGMRPVKHWVVGCWHSYLSGWDADLHMAQLMPLPIIISCSSKSRLVLPEWFFFSGAVLPRLSWKKPLNECSSIFTIFLCCGCTP